MLSLAPFVLKLRQSLCWTAMASTAMLALSIAAMACGACALCNRLAPLLLAKCTSSI